MICNGLESFQVELNENLLDICVEINIAKTDQCKLLHIIFYKIEYRKRAIIIRG